MDTSSNACPIQQEKKAIKLKDNLYIYIYTQGIFL